MATIVDPGVQPGDEAEPMTDQQAAVLLVESVKNALANGTRHFHPETEEPLNTMLEILTCLRNTGSVVLGPPDSEPLT